MDGVQTTGHSETNPGSLAICHTRPKNLNNMGNKKTENGGREVKKIIHRMTLYAFDCNLFYGVQLPDLVLWSR